MDRAAWKAEGQITLIVTIAYCSLFLFTFAVLMPLQDIFFYWLPMSISLLFLPHGVRILTTYFYGWKSIFYLLPGHLITWAYLKYALESEQDVYSVLISISASFLAVCLVFRSWSSHSDSQLGSHWKLIVLAGALASLGNGLGHALLYGNLIDTAFISLTLGYLIGDVSGLFFLMLALIFVNRLVRARQV